MEHCCVVSREQQRVCGAVRAAIKGGGQLDRMCSGGEENGTKRSREARERLRRDMGRIDDLFISLHWETALTSPTATSLFFSHPEPQLETSSAHTHKCVYAYVCACRRARASCE